MKLPSGLLAFLVIIASALVGYYVWNKAYVQVPPRGSSLQGALGNNQHKLRERLYSKNDQNFLVDPDFLVIGCDPFPNTGKEELVPTSDSDPNLDCIESIDDPQFVAAQDSRGWVLDDDLVIGLAHQGEDRAYPVKTIFKHEVVNDQIKDSQFLVTYCPLVGGAVAFKFSGKVNPDKFGVSGRLYNNDLVLYDRTSYSLWLQVTGQSVAGPRMRETLEKIPLEVVPWKVWRSLHPSTLVLKSSQLARGPAANFERFFATYEKKPDVPYPLASIQSTFPPKSWVRGIIVDATAKAYAENRLYERRVINDSISDVPLAFFSSSKDRRIRIFRREANGKILTFRFVAAKEGDYIEDQETKSRWTLDGVATSGPLKDTQLNPIIDIRLYWFSWNSIYPETLVYKD